MGISLFDIFELIMCHNLTILLKKDQFDRYFHGLR